MSSISAQGSYLRLTHFPPRERKNSSIPIKSRKKLLKSRGICGFYFLLICLLHTRNWLQFGSHVIPRLSRFSPIKIPFFIFCATKMRFYPENSTIFAQFLWFFRDLKKFCGLFSLSGGIRVAYLIVFFYIFYYIIYILYTYIFYLFLSNILLFQQYTKIKNRFLLNSLILPQKIGIITKSRKNLLN